MTQIDSEQFQKVLRYIRSGIEGKATLECGGERFGSKGYFIQPTVFSNVQARLIDSHISIPSLLLMNIIMNFMSQLIRTIWR